MLISPSFISNGSLEKLNKYINPEHALGFYNKSMKNFLVHKIVKFLFLFFISITIHAGGNESDSLLMESLDEVLIEEYKPCYCLLYTSDAADE